MYGFENLRQNLPIRQFRISMDAIVFWNIHQVHWIFAIYPNHFLSAAIRHFDQRPTNQCTNWVYWWPWYLLLVQDSLDFLKHQAQPMIRMKTRVFMLKVLISFSIIWCNFSFNFSVFCFEFETNFNKNEKKILKKNW